MFATLMLILIVITVGSAFAFMLALNEKQYIERQSVLEDQKSENLKVVSITPEEDPSCNCTWMGFNLTIFNSDIKDSRLTAISINDKFFLNHLFLNDTGYEDLDFNGTPDITNNSKKVIIIPAEQAVKIHVGAYYNNSTIEFPNNEPYPPDSADQVFSIKQPIKVELLTSKVNLFTRVFSPPIPIASMTYGTGINPSLLLDGSGSTAPNGFVTKYQWDVNDNGNIIVKYGMKQSVPYVYGDRYEINLKITDNYGMCSDLSSSSGNITI
jgi:hypothetical protein